MKYLFVLGLCLVISSLAAGHGYGRTRTRKVKPAIKPYYDDDDSFIGAKPFIQPKPVIAAAKPIYKPKPVMPVKPLIKPKPIIAHKPVIAPKPVIAHKPIIHPKPVIQPKPIIQPKPAILPGIGGPFNPMGGEVMPPEIQAILGSTVNGMPIRGGMGGFPQHGGSGTDPSGLRNGWGADPMEPMINDGWTDPFNGAAYPVNYQGGELIFDPVENRYMHQQAKQEEHIRVKNGGLMVNAGIPPVGVAPIAPVASPVHNMIKTENHIAMKSGGISAGKPSYLGSPIGDNYVGLSQIGGHPGIGVNPIEHNMVKASVGGPMGIVPPVNPVQAVHEVSKSGIAAVGHDRLAANIGHNVAKQVIKESARAVDIGSGGGVSMHHPAALAATDSLAQEAAHVAGKTLRVASQTNPINPMGPIGVGNGIFGGVPPKAIVHPRPAVKQQIRAFPTGYGRRRY